MADDKKTQLGTAPGRTVRPTGGQQPAAAVGTPVPAPNMERPGFTPGRGTENWRSWLLGKGAVVVRGDDGDDAVRDATTAAIAAQGLGVKPWRVIATSAAALARAAALAGPRATLTAYVDGKAPALPAELLAREVTVIGVAGPHPDLIVEAAALCVKGDIDLVGGVAIGGGDDVTRATVIPS